MHLALVLIVKQLLQLFVAGRQLFVAGGDLFLGSGDLGGIALHHLILGLPLTAQILGYAAVLGDLAFHGAVLIAVGQLAVFNDLHTHLDVHGLVLALINIGQGCGDLARNSQRAVGNLLRLLGLPRMLVLQLGAALLQLLAGLLTATALLLLGGQALLSGGDRKLDGLDPFLGVGDGVGGNLILAVAVVVLIGQRADTLQHLGGLGLGVLRILEQLLALRLIVINGLLGDLQVIAAVAEILLCLLRFYAQTVGVIDPKLHIQLFLLLDQLDGTFGALGGLFQRSDLCADLLENIVDTGHIFLGGGQLSLGFSLIVTVFRNTRGVLEHTAALVGFTGNDLGNLTLTDDRIAVLTHARVHKQLLNITQQAGLTVDEIFALTGAVATSGDHDLVIWVIQSIFGIGVVKGHRNLGKSHGTSAVGTRKDNVFHFGTAQALGGCFTQNPSHCIGNVGLTASVGTHDDRGTALKDQFGLIGEGLKSVHFQRLQIQNASPPFFII